MSLEEFEVEYKKQVNEVVLKSLSAQIKFLGTFWLMHVLLLVSLLS